MKITIGADHGGYEIKEKLKATLTRQGHRVTDVGTRSGEPCDYPEFAYRAALEVSLGRAERGILVCKSGMGMCIVANKVKGVRAALSRDVASAKLSRAHNDANILVLGAQDLEDDAETVVAAWLEAPFEEGRHKRRVDQISALEEKEFGGRRC